jgi:hypothetical protein
MSNSQKAAIDFWYEFDDFFLFRSPSDIRVAIGKLNPYGRLLDLFFHYQRKGEIKTGFKAEFENIKDSIKLLADNNLRIIDQHFKDNIELEQNAYELFAQGLLFDNALGDNGLPRRPEGDKIHMMDSGIVGYIVWHAFIRITILLELGGNSERWLQIDRHLALAAAILSALIKSGKPPIQSDDPSHNKPIEPSLLNELRRHWLQLSFEELDDKIVQLQEKVISRHI